MKQPKKKEMNFKGMKHTENEFWILFEIQNEY